LLPLGNCKISSFEKTLKATIAKTYIITATIIAISVANFLAIIPINTEYVKYEQIPIIATAISGFIKIFEIGKLSLIFFLNAVLAIVKAITWHTTDAHAAPQAPKAGFGTNIKFKTNFASTPAPKRHRWYH